MIIAKTRKWGNSVGLLLPKKEIQKLGIGIDEDIGIEIVKKGNPLKELFGFGKEKQITRKEFLEERKRLESRYE